MTGNPDPIRSGKRERCLERLARASMAMVCGARESRSHQVRVCFRVKGVCGGGGGGGGGLMACCVTVVLLKYKTWHYTCETRISDGTSRGCID